MAAHIYELRPRKDDRGVDLISDALPFGRLWHGEPDAISNAVDYAKPNEAQVFRKLVQLWLIRICRTAAINSRVNRPAVF